MKTKNILKTIAMNKYLEDVSRNTAVIAHNTTVTAYYSKVNAELTKERFLIQEKV